MIRRPSALLGALLGGLSAIALTALLYLGDRLAALPFVPFDLFDWLARVLPGDIIRLSIDAIVRTVGTLHLGETSSMAKLIEQLLAIALMLGIGLFLGASIAVMLGRGSARAWKVGADAGAGLFLLVIAIEFDLAPVIAHQPLAIIWLAILVISWGTILGTMLGRVGLAAAAPLTDANRSSRRALLIKFVVGSLGLATGAWAVGSRSSTSQTPADAGQPLPQPSPTGPIEATPPTTVMLPTTEPASTAQATAIATLQASIDPAPGTRPAITPNDRFYRIDINTRPPNVGPTWQLAVTGLFTRDRSLTLADLMHYPPTTQPITIGCISNPVGGDLISTSNWTGVQLRTVLHDLGLRPEAQALALQAADGFYESVTLPDMLDARTLLVYGMNGTTLPLEHGYPLRIYIPNHYGMKQPKWITRMEALNHPGKGYWVDRGWNKDAYPQILAIIDPIMPGTAPTDHLPIGGIAWAGARGIRKVELQVNGGAWAQATLLQPPPGPLTWYLWRFDWPRRSGHHTFRVRATDGTGQLQPARSTDPYPDGAIGYHMVSISL